MKRDALERQKPAMNNAGSTPLQRPSNACATLSPIPPRCCTRPAGAGCTPDVGQATNEADMSNHLHFRDDTLVPAIQPPEFWRDLYEQALTCGMYDLAAIVRDIGLDAGLIARRLN